MYHNDLPSCMTVHIVKLQPTYNLRNSLKLEIPPFKSNIKKYSRSYRGPVLWNHLPIECRNANCVKSFSRMINKLTLIRDIDFSNLYCRRQLLFKRSFQVYNFISQIILPIINLNINSCLLSIFFFFFTRPHKLYSLYTYRV